MNNSTFQKSIRLLAHPLTLTAIGLMLANDLVLKPLAPSWLTGKLSDFAGLFFLPFLLAALFALVRPGRCGGIAAFAITAAGFALLKLSPAANAAALGLANGLTGLHLHAVSDPTDLLALLSLLPAAWLWRRPVPPSLPALRWRLLVLPLAALVTLADAAAPDYGVKCLAQPASGSIIVSTRAPFVQSYQSQDGGLTWQALSGDAASSCQSETAPNNGPAPLTNPADGVMYRFIPAQGIDRSEDKGATWHNIYTFQPLSEPDEAYVKMTYPSNIEFGNPPYAAIFDSATGNMVVAMGLEGVLVRKADGTWTWAAVGPYRHDSLSQDGVAGLQTLLFYQMSLAVLVGLGWLFTRGARLMPGRAPGVWTILGWVGLAVLSLLVVPDIATANYLSVGTWIGLGFMSIATVIALLVALINLKGRFFRMLPVGLLQAILLTAACFAPYVLWATHVLPAYSYALLGSTGLVLILFILFSLGKHSQKEQTL